MAKQKKQSYSANLNPFSVYLHTCSFPACSLQIVLALFLPFTRIDRVLELGTIEIIHSDTETVQVSACLSPFLPDTETFVCVCLRVRRSG